MSSLPPEAVALAAAQHGRLSRRELLHLGLRPHTVDNLVRSGALVVDFPGEYLVAGTPETLHQQLLGEVRRARGRAADETVLALHAAAGFLLEPPFAVAVPRARRLRRGGVRAVRVDLGEDDVEVFQGIPAMRLERALIGVLPRTRRARFRTAFHDLRRRGALDLPHLRRLATALGEAPGAAEMRALLANGELVPESPPEHELGGIWLPGDPTPAPQVWITHEGRYFRLDWVFLASRVAPEYDGAEAHGRAARHADAVRTLALAACGIVRLPITAALLRRPDVLRERLLGVHQERVRAGTPPLVPVAPPAWWNGL